jgi:hypothetical protein
MKPKKRKHTSITGKTLFGTEAEFYLAMILPLGRWTCADGREVLFNAFEEPIWQRWPGIKATPADPYERVSGILWTEWIYTDADRHHEKRLFAKTWLNDFKAGFKITLPVQRRMRSHG